MPHVADPPSTAQLEWNPAGNYRSFIDLNKQAHDFFEPSDDFPHGFPAPHDYGDFIPGWDFFDDFFIRMRLTFTIGLEVVIMGYIISREEGRAVNFLGSIILGIVVAAPVILTLLSPKNDMGGAGKRFRLICSARIHSPRLHILDHKSRIQSVEGPFQHGLLS